MGLIKYMCERHEKRKERKKYLNNLKSYLDTTLPCTNIVKLSDSFNHIYVLLEYSPTMLAMLLNTRLNFVCKFKILTGFNAGKVYNVSRYNSDKYICKFELDMYDRLMISALGYKNENVEIDITKKNQLQQQFGDNVTVRDFIQLNKIEHQQKSNINLRKYADRNRIKSLYESEDIFLKEEYIDYSSKTGKEC